MLSLAAATIAAAAPAQQPLPQQPRQQPPASSPPAQPPAAEVGTRLPEVLVTESETGGDRDLEEVPIDHGGGRDLIGPREARTSGAMNIQELLRRSPGVFLQEETGSDSLPNLSLRGVTNGAEGAWRSINLGMYVDGIPLAPAPYGGPGNSLFPFTLERVHAVDIQRGGGAVRYGPNNVSGVINFLTRPIPERTMVHTRLRYDTFENASLYAATGGTEGPLGVLVEAVYKDGETFRDGGDYTIENYALKSSYRLSDSVRLLGQFETYEDDTHLADGLSLAEYERDPKQTLSPQNRFRGEQDRANLKLEWDVDRDTLFELITYWYDGNRTFFLGSPTFYGLTGNLQFIQTTPRPMRTAAVQPQLTHSYAVAGGTGELHVGLRYLQEDIVRTVSRYFPNGTSQIRRSEEQYDYYTASAWIENTFRLDDWTVTPGVRLEYVQIDAKNRINGVGVEKNFTEVLPGLTLARRLTETWSLFGGVQSTFAAPQAPQISITSNPQDVSAQYAWVYEVGSRTRGLDGLLGTDVTLYHIDYSDRLVQDPNQFDVFVNAGSSRHRGVELALTSELGAIGLAGVELWGATAWNDSKFTDGEFDGNRFAGAPRWLASWGARYRHESSGVWLSIDGSYVGPAFTDAANTRNLTANGTAGIRPSYALWNAGIGWDTRLGDTDEFTLIIGGRNILDEQYFEPRTARGIFPGAPASLVFQLGVTHTF
ncbi:MAG: TonB-dependent receptor [Planctomycetes bacterium]|nr:TonB-dependent receptor [Planctomycetota bacterium]